MTDLKTERWRNCNHNDRSISTDSAKSQFLFPKEKEKEIDYKMNSRVCDNLHLSIYTKNGKFSIRIDKQRTGMRKAIISKESVVTEGIAHIHQV